MSKNEDEKSKIVFKGYLEPPDELKEGWEISSALNREYAETLPLNRKFLEDIRKIREEFDVPIFKIGDDVSGWFDDLIETDITGKIIDDSKQRAFNKAVLKILKTHELPINFLGWVTDWVFGNQKPEWKPLYNYVAFEDLEDQAKLKLPLTTQEIRWLKRYWRSFEKKVSGNRHLPKDFKRISKALDQSKNRRRRLRNFERDKKILMEADKRRLKATEEMPDYLKNLMQSGNYSRWQLKEWKKNWRREYPDRFTTIPKYTSKHIDAKFTRKKDKGSYIRTRLSRLKRRA